MMKSCTRRCQQVPGAFGPSVLAPAISVCRSCGQPERRTPAPAREAVVAPASALPVLYTLGYAGMRLEQVLQALLERQIAVLVDTRWSAWSENPGFCQDTLRRAVQGHGIAYRHLAPLGSSPALRSRLKAEGDWAAFVAAYTSGLAGQEDLVQRVAAYARDHRLCLLCMEHAPDHCHRSVLAEPAGLAIEHLQAW